MALPTERPEDFIKSIAQLAASATGFSVHEIEAPSSMEGIPGQVMIGFDHRKTGPDAVVDLGPLFERYRWRPERRTGTAKVSTLDSFISLVLRHKTPHSAIFAQTELPDPQFTAVIDYHGIDHTPAFLKHRIVYTFPFSEEFRTWRDNDGNAMSQVEFAAFIEENIAHIATPTTEEEVAFGSAFRTTMASPSGMMELSRGLEVTVNGQVKGAHRLQSGEMQIAYSEEHQTSLTVPGLFIVSIPVFFGGAVVRLPARLRYRVANGKVVWFYQLYRHRELIRERVLMDLDRTIEHTTLPVYEGSPEA